MKDIYSNILVEEVQTFCEKPLKTKIDVVEAKMIFYAIVRFKSITRK